MRAEELLKTKQAPVTIHKDKLVQDAMRLLIENKIGSLVVVGDDNRPVGIVTEHDIFKLAYRFRGDMMDMPVGDHMTKKLLLSRPGDEINRVAEKMVENKVRHMPITDEEENLRGVLSVRDVLMALLNKQVV